MSTDTRVFREHVDFLLREQKGPAAEASSADLLMHLGCRSVVSGVGKWVMSAAGTIPDSQEYFVCATLVDLLTAHVRKPDESDEWAMALLDGLLHCERWRLCLETEDGAYALALALRKFRFLTAPGFVGEDYRVLLSESLGPGVRKLLEAWSPRTDLASVSISVDGLTRALFGDVWCDLFAIVPAESRPYQAFNQVQATIICFRPDFVPGLLPAYLERAPIALPGL